MILLISSFDANPADDFQNTKKYNFKYKCKYISGMILLLSSLLIKAAFAANPAEDLQNCLQTNSVLDDCLKE